MTAPPARAARRLIVNADDLGRSRAVNDATFDAMAAGLVTSATVMANGAALDDAARRVADHPRCSFGAHLTLSWGAPVGGAGPLRALLDGDGHLSDAVWRARFDSSLRRAVEDEWCAQVARLREVGIAVSHFDSHQHVHTLPGLFSVIGRVMRRTGISVVRLTKNLYSPDLPAGSAALSLKKALWNTALRSWHGARTTSRFADLRSVLRLAESGRLPEGTIEAMVHPGDAVDPLMIAEMEELHAGGLSRMPPGTALISYREL